MYWQGLMWYSKYGHTLSNGPSDASNHSHSKIAPPLTFQANGRNKGQWHYATPVFLYRGILSKGLIYLNHLDSPLESPHPPASDKTPLLHGTLTDSSDVLLQPQNR